MRLFIAINLYDNFKSALTSMQDDLRSQHVGGNYSPIENLHITLAFIGEYPDPDDVMDALAGIDFEPFGNFYALIVTHNAYQICTKHMHFVKILFFSLSTAKLH